MRSLFERIRNRKVVMGIVSSLLAIALFLSGMTIEDRLSSESDSDFSVGIGQKVITIGPVAYAAGTADYTVDGVADDVQFQAALNALPANGGKISVLSGNYVFAATVTRAIPNVTIEGNGYSTNLTFNGADPLFTAGGNRWVFRNLVTDAGGINMGATTGWQWQNVTAGATSYAFRDDGTSVLGTANITTINNQLFNFTNLIDHDAGPIKYVLTAGTALTIGQAVYIGSDGKYEKSVATNVTATSQAQFVVVSVNIAENATGNFIPINSGSFMRDDTWNWTVGGYIYLDDDTAGLLTQVVPGDPGDIVQIVAIAITEDIIAMVSPVWVEVQ